MKHSLYFLLVSSLFLASTFTQAQVLLQEDFAYPAGVPLVQNAMASMENVDATTGWRTMNNSNAGTNAFNIVTPGLTYPGYAGSGVGNALKILDNGGQDVFKSFSPIVPLVCPKTIYVSFLINVPPGDKSGADFVFGIKYSNNAADANFFGRFFAVVSGNDVTFGISKSTSPSGILTSTPYKTNTTYLMVLKYTCGGLNGANVTEETGKYDDKVDLFINPDLSAPEPATPTLSYTNTQDRDAYRYGSNNNLIGGLATVYLRTPTVGAIPEATFDGFRVYERWSNVTSTHTVGGQTFSLFTDPVAQRVRVQWEDAPAATQYAVYNLAGQLIQQGKVTQSDFFIDLPNCPKGMYMLQMRGKNGQGSAKFVMP